MGYKTEGPYFDSLQTQETMYLHQELLDWHCSPTNRLMYGCRYFPKVNLLFYFILIVYRI